MRHQKLLLRGLAAASQLGNLTDLVHQDVPLAALPKLMSRQAPAMSLRDVERCPLPSIQDVPIRHIPTTANGEALDYPGPEMWHGLNMNEWLDKAFDCPAIKFATCKTKSGYGACRLPLLLSSLFIGQIGGREEAPDYGDVNCDFLECHWDSYSNSGAGQPPTKGPMSGSNTRKVLTSRAGPDDILQYRRWYALVALKAMWREYQSLERIMDGGNTLSIAVMKDIIDIIGPMEKQEDVGNPEPLNTVGLGFFLPVLTLAADFVPYGSGIMSVFNLLLSAAEHGSNRDMVALWGDDASEALKLMVEAASKKDSLMSKSIKLMIDVTKSVKPFIRPDGTIAPPEDPVDSTVFSNFFYELLKETKLATASVATAALQGDPFAATGYLASVKTGLFSDWLQQDDWSTIAEAQIQWAEYLKEKVVMEIYKTRNVYLYRKSYPNKRSCEEQLSTTSRRTFAGHYPSGEACLPVREGQDDSSAPHHLYVALVPMNWDNWSRQRAEQTDVFGHYIPTPDPYLLQRYKGLAEWKLPRVNEEFTLKKIYTKSAQCFEARNQNFLESQGLRICQANWWNPSNVSPVNSYPDASRRNPALGVRDVRGNECFYNIPVFDADHPAFKTSCEAQWPAAVRTNYWETQQSGSGAQYNVNWDYLTNPRTEYCRSHTCYRGDSFSWTPLYTRLITGSSDGDSCPFSYRSRNGPDLKAGPGMNFARALFFPESGNWCKPHTTLVDGAHAIDLSTHWTPETDLPPGNPEDFWNRFWQDWPHNWRPNIMIS